MRIGLFTDTYYPEINGVANSVFLLKKELEARGHQVYVFTVSNPKMKEPETHVYRIRSVACPLMRERRMGCAFLQNWYGTIAGLHLDVIHTQTEFMIGHLGRRAARMLGIPLIHTYHTLYEDYTHYLKVPGNDKLKGMVRILSRWCCDRADLVIAPTEKVRKMLMRYGVTRPIVIQPTGVPIRKFKMTDWQMVEALRKKYGLTKEDHILISIGRLSHEKNLQELIGFMKTLSRADVKSRLLIVGDGPEKKQLEDMVEEQGLQGSVLFTGQAPWKQIQNFYALGDVFVCASRSETQGLTYIEAMASGKPILVCRDECLDGILKQSVNGYAYENREEFIRFYQQMMNRKQYETMREQALESAEQWSAEAFGKHMEQIYESAVKEKAEEGQGIYGGIRFLAG